jgi:hypothetical protein
VRNRYLIVRYVNRDDRPPDSMLEEGSASQQSIRSDAFNDRRQSLHDGLRSTSSRPMTCSFALDVRKSRSIVGPPVASSCSTNVAVVRILVAHRSFGTSQQCSGFTVPRNRQNYLRLKQYYCLLNGILFCIWDATFGSVDSYSRH